MATELWVPQPEPFKGPWYQDPRWRLGILVGVLAAVILYEVLTQ